MLRQRVLFAGLNCLPNQRDLFETDGRLDERIERYRKMDLNLLHEFAALAESRTGKASAQQPAQNATAAAGGSDASA